MPPKKSSGDSKAKDTTKKKKDAATKAKQAEDKTFGLKNKNKSKAVQSHVRQITQNVAQAHKPGPPPRDKKKEEEERKREMAQLYAEAIKQPKVPPGVDPKSVVCEFYRHGQCTKGFKCKFSHDLNVEKKAAKIDLFSDKRDARQEEPEEGENMEDWDQAELERVVKEKHSKEKPPNATNIICKYFLEAVETKKYGWFWKCPNGNECKYKHALPPGFVFKSQMKELLEEEKANKKDAAEEIEEERAKVEARTPITQDVFKMWRAKKIEARRKKDEAELEERRKKGILTGREIFAQEGFQAQDDASASEDVPTTTQNEQEAAIKEMLDKAKAAAEHARQRAATEPSSLPPPPPSDSEEEEQDGEEEGEDNGEDGGEQGGEQQQHGDSGGTANGDGAGPSTTLQLQEGDEQLFEDDDDDEDLDQIENSIKGTKLSE
mmetsp:Transcript_1528/g.3707  ORF Transcript_1528/g.3707 Transcript_1528/m.3707 type:complete len:434 (-) Transcript_1528:240-1541(-)|eukprot:CAMPEP_0202347262 /NCGR_PEP_ID=MMETSP1126-20121109/5700_1 /ASSEMBLY_ACC=CAM_ASM_000457 /TAXON_ID=3047 /ORGANISM="Dunaliella tertiolecta, Strain CCMP1320" /LENGTH=433 /DNA_ID=CAMNT_0048938789 /DNA_START=165 /DNA_END=1466 /DNA_ORIENTATION=-